MVHANPEVERAYMGVGSVGDWYDLSGDAIVKLRLGSAAGSGRAISSKGASLLAGQDVRLQLLNAPYHVELRSLLDRPPSNPTEDLRHRLDNANRHFRRKAAAVLGDEEAVRLLAKMFKLVTLPFDDFDTCEEGIALAKLTAANFCEIGSNVIYITEAGQNFIEALDGE
ncbi:MAG: hypothetical protein J4G14_06050 [Dehalococcoidia bacterium]|nr:hypothetical protein [Dehalococcoidia bacterium]